MDDSVNLLDLAGDITRYKESYAADYVALYQAEQALGNKDGHAIKALLLARELLPGELEELTDETVVQEMLKDDSSVKGLAKAYGIVGIREHTLGRSLPALLCFERAQALDPSNTDHKLHYERFVNNYI